jgi:hypothetical protein
MSIKSILSITLFAALTATGSVSFADPGKTDLAAIQPQVKLLSAKIENTIADLDLDKTEFNVRNAAVFLLASLDLDTEIKSQAVYEVIRHADAIGDTIVVEALSAIEFESVEVEEKPEQPTVVNNVPANFPPPPAAKPQSGSDY